MSLNETKTALIVEDDLGIAEFYQVFFKIAKGYEAHIADINNLEKYTQHYDFIIFDGLNGGCFDLYDKLKGKRKVICTGDINIFKKAQEKNIEVFLKPTYIGKILDGKND